ncbi:hypothetical protein ANOM_003629 [Aspergillus nomiae NRRL 13137]|uniref:Haemolytic enterotoxin (HBL) n=1 Tax=Aspergillus nomiae NRRL (strain ATCC 15546 / NRRL 13137 / CBS 260.88 / M93) TaxID=1509407 RepID=A0A0L1J7C2_ASPN3|nr:uncharacterized protein ANOM_003629 [Aspergillus nomiae NRRL 13137]KNG87642.1 hypothetical protein ANOM_003629 [Aspergillus nomiae NRRL 13137]
MAAVPPPYVAGDSPPSYDEVASKVNQLVGSSPTPQKYLDVAASLSDAERKVLKDGAEAHNPIQTEEDKEKLSLGAAKTMSTDETVAKLKEDAAAAGAAVVAIDGSFTALQVQIASIDQLEKTNFLTQLNEQKKKYRDVLQKSRLLAADISQYGSSFDELIVPLCADQSLTVDQRLEQIDKFIARANDFQEQGNEINKSFDTLIDGFVEFTAQFSSWGKDKEQELNNDIKEIDKQLAELTQKLADLRTSLIALGVGLGVGLSAAGIGLALSGPVAPFILIGGLIFAGATAAAVAGIAIAMGVVSNQIEEKKRERQDKSDEIDKIRLARRNLEDMGNSQLTVFRDNVKVLQSYWTSMQADAEAIKGWLKSGADMANVPKYMKIALDEAVTVYASMAQYMDEYAKGTNL